MKAKQIKAQFEAQNKRSIKHHSARRGMLAGIAAAAAVLVCGAVTVGAVNDWNYAAVFSKYFSEKSGETVYYDFTGMGMDIGQVIEGDGFTMTIQSVVADANAVYVAYDIALSDEINERLAAYDDIEISTNLHVSIIQQGSTNNFCGIGISGTGGIPYRTDDNVWHCMDTEEIQFGTDLTDKLLQISVPDDLHTIRIGYNFPPPEAHAPGESIDLYAPEQTYTYDLTDITVQPGIEAAYNRTLPNDKNQNVFETVQITPFGLHFIHNDHFVSDSGNARLIWDLPGVPVTYTAVYADGTEVEILLGSLSKVSGSSQSLNEETGGYDLMMFADTYFAVPLELDGLVAVRMNDIEIPVQ